MSSVAHVVLYCNTPTESDTAVALTLRDMERGYPLVMLACSSCLHLGRAFLRRGLILTSVHDSMIMTFEATDDGMLVLDTPPMMVFVPIVREHFPWANELRMLSWSSNLSTEPVGLLVMYWLLSLRILHASRLAENAPPTGTLRGSLARRV